MSNEVAIKVHNLNKSFDLPENRITSLKQLFLNYGKKRKKNQQIVLDSIDFEINKGDFLGIVGKNGSGKSTLLKILAGVYSPDEGAVEVNGTLTPFIELGVGFNPELSGKDNVYLNGALLGFSRDQMSAMYNDIVSFAELEEHMDKKLKNYSSGMQVRLAFSIAIRAESDILLIDEVLAVGDAAFQKKCLEVFERYKGSGRTVILVTHDMDVVEKYCTKAMFLESGKFSASGSPKEIAAQYREKNDDAYERSLVNGAAITRKRSNKRYNGNLGLKVTTLNDKKLLKKVFEVGDKCTIRMSWKNNAVANVGVALMKQTGEYMHGANTFSEPMDLSSMSVDYSVSLDVEPGNYRFVVGLFGESRADELDYLEDGLDIHIKATNELKWAGLVKLDHDWSNNV